MVNPNILMKGNDTKRQILLSYYESDEPIDQITVKRTKQKVLLNDDDKTITETTTGNITERSEFK